MYIFTSNYLNAMKQKQYKNTIFEGRDLIKSKYRYDLENKIKSFCRKYLNCKTENIKFRKKFGLVCSPKDNHEIIGWIVKL